MRKMLRQSAVAMAFVGVISAVPAMAQQAPVPSEPEQQQRVKDPAPVSGELVSLDDKAKSLVIRTESGNEMEFAYTATTEIIGADKGVSGLATMSGTPVTVHYSTHGTANTAVKIEVKAKS